MAHRVVWSLSWPHKSWDDREIVLDLSAHPKHDEALCFLRGESHIDRMTLESLNNKPCSISPIQTHTHTHIKANFHLSKNCLAYADSDTEYKVLTRRPPCRFPALPATERVLINKATNSMERENKRKEREREAEGARRAIISK